jgi:hypothetical protein
MRLLRASRRAIPLSIGLLLVGTGVAAAASTAFLVGSTNHEQAGSTLRDTGSGAALRLSSSHNTPLELFGTHGRPPLAVDTSTQVPRLNAGLLDGKPASAFSALGPKAWAFWNTGSLVAPHGILSMKTLATGEYCFALAAGLAGTSPAVITPEYEFSSSADLGAWEATGLSGCTARNDFAVVTQQHGAASQNVAFEFVVF